MGEKISIKTNLESVLLFENSITNPPHTFNYLFKINIYYNKIKVTI